MQDPCHMKSSVSLIIVALAVAALLGGVVYLAWPLFSARNDPEQTRRLITEAGAWGPLLLETISKRGQHHAEPVYAVPV